MGMGCFKQNVVALFFFFFFFSAVAYGGWLSDEQTLRGVLIWVGGIRGLLISDGVWMGWDFSFSATDSQCSSVLC